MLIPVVVAILIATLAIIAWETYESGHLQYKLWTTNISNYIYNNTNNNTLGASIPVVVHGPDINMSAVTFTTFDVQRAQVRFPYLATGFTRALGLPATGTVIPSDTARMQMVEDAERLQRWFFEHQHPPEQWCTGTVAGKLKIYDMVGVSFKYIPEFMEPLYVNLSNTCTHMQNTNSFHTGLVGLLKFIQ